MQSYVNLIKIFSSSVKLVAFHGLNNKPEMTTELQDFPS
jgi:hypothetical protein